MVKRPLTDELSSLPASLAERLARHGFDRKWFSEMATRSKEGPSDNRVRGAVEPPRPGDIRDLPDRGSPEWDRLERIGNEALSLGQCALVVLAGGMATRMGGVVKALVEALPGKTFLDLRLGEQRSLEKRTGKLVPLWLMTSQATDGPIRAALGERLDGYHVAAFPQNLALRVTKEGALLRGADGAPSEYSPGHGDLPEALQKSALLSRFLEAGGRYVMMANLDNLGATLSPVLIGLHLEGRKPVTCEVVDKVGSDRGGIPVRHDGRLVVLEEFRIPETFDPATVRVFNTNTFHFDARALLDLQIRWTYFVVQKTVDGQTAIQFERLVNEVTSHLDTLYVRVPRSGVESRFLPVKDLDELAQRRGELEAVAGSRGMLD
jgi:UTP--glucose-1-phosphate uridylyltransferase